MRFLPVFLVIAANGTVFPDDYEIDGFLCVPELPIRPPQA